MKTQSTPPGIFILVIVAAAMSVFFFVTVFRDYYTTQPRDTIAKGIVSEATYQGKGNRYRVRFATEKGKWVEIQNHFSTNVSSMQRKLAVGDTVEVIYNKTQPEKGRANFPEELDNDGLVLVFAVIILMGWAGAGAYVYRRRNRV